MHDKGLWVEVKPRNEGTAGGWLCGINVALIHLEAH
jgi:hypothetical protein